MSEIKVEVDLNFKFKGLNGEPLKSNGTELAPANQLVANFLYNGFAQEKADKTRNRAWSVQLYNTGKLLMSKKEIEALLQSCVNGGMADGVYCELQDYMDERKEEWQKLHEASKKAPKDE